MRSGEVAEREIPGQALSEVLYADYVEWKGWSEFLTYSDLDRDRYESDFAGIVFSGKRVLEIGFGNGSFLAWAREKGADIVGCEISAHNRDQARRAGIELIDEAFEEGRGLDPSSLDIVVALDVFEHLSPEEIHAKLCALSDALRPGGLVVLRYPNGQSPFGLVAQYGDMTHRTVLSKDRVEQLIVGCGLATERYKGAAFPRHNNAAHRVLCLARMVARRALYATVHFALATNVCLDPNVVHVLRREKPN